MEKVKQYLIPVLIIIMAIALAVTMFSTLIYQYKRSGIRKRLHSEKVETNIIEKVLQEYGTGALIQKFKKPDSIYYIACQDEKQIIAATKGISELSSIWSDIFLSEAFSKEKRAHRIQRLELHLMRRLVLQGAVFVFIILIIVLYFINIHSNRLLAREHDNMMVEVERIQQQLRQQERTAAMGQLAAGVAHEIRNPLNAIQILTQRIEREIQPEERDREKFIQFTRVIREEIKRLNEIVKQFLNFTSIKQPDFKKCNPLDIAKDIVLLENGVAHQKDINIKLKINKKPVFIKADSYLLKQALVNVIKNAIEATPEYGKIIVSISQNNKTTDFIIEDNGIGMNEEEREKAFNLYFSTKNHGTGLGLAITRRIVDQHNGEIIIQPRKSNGTIIIIRIPNRRENEFIGN